MYNGMYTEGGREGGRGGGGMKGGRDWEKEEKRESERENTYLFCKLVGDTYIHVPYALLLIMYTMLWITGAS